MFGNLGVPDGVDLLRMKPFLVFTQFWACFALGVRSGASVPFQVQEVSDRRDSRLGVSLMLYLAGASVEVCRR